MLNSLKFWLGVISENQNREFTHREISVLTNQFLIHQVLNENLRLKIYPLLLALDGEGTHSHKAFIARFALKMIKEHEEEEERRNNTEDFF
jgi:hypothetical protein